MKKIAASTLDHLLVKSAALHRTQQARIQELEGRLADSNRRDHAEKIASIAVERGVMEPTGAADYAAHLAGSDRDLSLVEDFVARSTGPGIGLGQVLDKTASDNSGYADGSAEQRFETALLSLS